MIGHLRLDHGRSPSLLLRRDQAHGSAQALKIRLGGCVRPRIDILLAQTAAGSDLGVTEVEDNIVILVVIYGITFAGLPLLRKGSGRFGVFSGGKLDR